MAKSNSAAGQATEKLRDLQHEVLVAAASSDELGSVFRLLCRRVEELNPGTICSILRVDSAGLIRPLAAPSLPEQFSELLNGLAIGPCAGSCGTAAWRGEPVEARDIDNDPLWADYKGLVVPLGLHACWSTPIKARGGAVIGTFAFYYKETRGPTELERQSVEVSTHLCAIVIEQQESRSQVQRLAFYDTVTGLANRTLFQKRIKEYLAAKEVPVALLCVDVDDFKSVNDTYGHAAGDELLRQFGQRLQGCAGNGFVARLGGDEFALVQKNGCDEAHRTAENIMLAMKEPFILFGNTVSTQASVGIAFATDGERNIRTLMKQADLALYEAKARPGSAWQAFTHDLSAKHTEKRRVEHDLRAALTNGQLRLVYQPIFNLRTGSIAGAEALLRWDHPTRGAISPADFIPVAEQCGLMPEIGEWVLRTACSAAAAWPDNLRLSVNISPLQIQRPNFTAGILRIIAECGLPPTRLEVEITETALLRNGENTALVIDRLKAEGIRVALDDFGTGYSSLSHIQQFPIDTVKIDRSFVQEFGVSGVSTAIVTAILHIARELNIVSTAEGIETEGQLALIRSAGCLQAQGFQLARPLKPADFMDMVGMRAGTSEVARRA